MNTTKESLGAAVVLRFSGRLDALAASAALDALDAELDAGVDILVSLESLEYVSSAGLRVFLKAAKRAKANGTGLCLVALSGPVLEVFDSSGFSAFFDIAENEEEGARMLMD